MAAMAAKDKDKAQRGRGSTKKRGGGGAAPNADVVTFLASVEHPTRQADAQTLLKLFAEITGEPARMAGTSIIGYGSYEYQLANGKTSRAMRIGFSPRRANLVIYIMPGMAVAPELMKQLGKHKTGKSCLYINRLSDVDLDVLSRLARAAWDEMNRRHPN